MKLHCLRHAVLVAICLGLMIGVSLGETANLEKKESPAERFANATSDEARREILRTIAGDRDRSGVDVVVSLLQAPPTNHFLLSDAIAAADKLSSIYITSALIGLAHAGLPTNVLIQAIEVLGHKGSTDGLPALAPHLRSSAGRVRAAAAAAIGRSGGMPAINVTLPLLDDPSLAVRRSALTALGWFRHPRLIEPLTKAAADPTTRHEAMLALAGIPDLRALDRLLEGLGGRDAMVRDRCRRTLVLLQTEALPMLEARAENLPPLTVSELRRVYRSNETAKAGVLFQRDLKLPGISTYAAFASTNHGDRVNGRRLLEEDSRLGCLRCHAPDAADGAIAPVLGEVGSKLGRTEIIQSILRPGDRVCKGGEMTTLVLRRGAPLAGLLRRETTVRVALLDLDGHEHHVLKSNILERTSGGGSYMPEGLEAGLSLEEFADLVAALTGP